MYGNIEMYYIYIYEYNKKIKMHYYKVLIVCILLLYCIYTIYIYEIKRDDQTIVFKILTNTLCYRLSL